MDFNPFSIEFDRVQPDFTFEMFLGSGANVEIVQFPNCQQKTRIFNEILVQEMIEFSVILAIS